MDEALPTIEKGFPYTAVFVDLALFAVGFAFFINTGVNGTCGGRRNVRPQSSVTSIATAVEQYYVEYRVLPETGARLTTDTEGGIRLLNIVVGLVKTDEPSGNPRGIRFLAVREKKGDHGGGVRWSRQGRMGSWGRGMM